MRPMARSPRPPKGCRRTRWSIVVVPSLSIHPLLGSAGFHQLRCYYEEIRLLRGHRPVVVASFRSTARADPRRPPRVRTLDVPPLPPPLPPRPRLDFGRRVWRHAHPVGPACSRVHLRSVLRFASGFFSTRPHGARPGVSRRQSLHAVASSSRLLPTRPAKDFHLQSSAHARHTSVRGVTRTGIIWCVQHGHTRDDPSAPSGLNSRGAVVSSSLARRALYEAFPAEEA